MFHIEPITEKYRSFVDNQISESWAGPFIVTKGKLHGYLHHDNILLSSFKDGNHVHALRIRESKWKCHGKFIVCEYLT